MLTVPTCPTLKRPTGRQEMEADKARTRDSRDDTKRIPDNHLSVLAPNASLITLFPFYFQC